MKKKLWFVRILIVLLFALIFFFITLPALNLHDPGFYGYLFMVFVVYLITSGVNLFNREKLITKL